MPLLYPTPNRVKEGKLKYGDLELQFPPNNDTNFLHGLVHSVPFPVVEQKKDATSAELTAALVFDIGTAWHAKFPLQHTLRVSVRVAEGSVRWTYEVDNSTGKSPVPFGFALHPWFLDLEPRKTIRLTVPATD